jgi:amino acid transporter
MNNLFDSSTLKHTSKLAIASLALGIMSLLILSAFIIDGYDWDFFRVHFPWLQNLSDDLGFWKVIIYAIFVILSILFGWKAIAKIDNENNLKGKPFAITGMVCGSVFILFFIFIWLSFMFTGFR